MTATIESMLPAQPSRAERIREVTTTLLGCVGRHASAKAGLSDLPVHSLPTDVALALEQLGVTFIKLGQTLSSRKDLLPSDYVVALERLRDDVAPMTREVVEQQLEAAFGKGVDEVFEKFSWEPVGSASIGQVHRGTLWDGREVAVKVQRPEAAAQVQQDLNLLRSLTEGLDALGSFGAGVQMQEVVDVFAAGMRLELDYRVEARNLSRMREVTQHVVEVEVPRPITELTSKEVLVMAFVSGTPLSEVEGGIEDGERLATALCEAYFQQFLTYGFFHADPHPGNIILDSRGQLHIIDLGFVEVLDDNETQMVAELIGAVVQGDGRATAEVLTRACKPMAERDRAGLERETARIVRYATAMRGIEPTFGDTVYELIGATTDNGWQPPPRLATLARTLTLLDEVLERLAPGFDAAAIVEKRAEELAGGMAGMLGLPAGSIPQKLALRAPNQLSEILDQLAAGRFEISVDALDEEAIFGSMHKIANRIAGSVIVAALLMSGAMLQGSAGPTIAGISAQSAALLGLGGLGAVTLLLSILWFDR